MATKENSTAGGAGEEQEQEQAAIEGSNKFWRVLPEGIGGMPHPLADYKMWRRGDILPGSEFGVTLPHLLATGALEEVVIVDGRPFTASQLPPTLLEQNQQNQPANNQQ